jgi:hypothetical protein
LRANDYIVLFFHIWNSQSTCSSCLYHSLHHKFHCLQKWRFDPKITQCLTLWMTGWRILGYWDILPQWLGPSGMHSLSGVCNYYSPSIAVVTVAITRASLQWQLICSHFEPVDCVQMSLLNTFRKMKKGNHQVPILFLVLSSKLSLFNCFRSSYFFQALWTISLVCLIEKESITAKQ